MLNFGPLTYLISISLVPKLNIFLN